MSKISINDAITKALELQKNGKLTEADRIYTAVLKLDPSHPDANFNMALIAINMGKFEVALPFFRRSISSKPEINQYWLGYVATLKYLNNDIDADKAIKEAARLNIKIPQDVKLEITSANSLKLEIQKLYQLFNRRDCNKVINIADELLEKYPKSFELLNIKGAAYLQSNAPHEAIKIFRQSIIINPNFAETYYNAGLAAGLLKKYQDAINYYSKAIELRPDYAVALNNLGSCFYEIQEIALAIEYYNKAIVLKSDYGAAWNNLGAAQIGNGDVQSAIFSFANALNINHDFTSAAKNLSSILSNVVFSDYNSIIETAILTVLKQKNLIRPIQIARAAASLILVNPKFKPLVKKLENIDCSQDIETIIVSLSEIPLLIQLMYSCQIPNLALEKFITRLRQALLNHIHKLENSTRVSEFLTHLAYNCFINEYVFALTSEEIEKVRELDDHISSSLESDKQPNLNAVLCLATFKPLTECKWVSKILKNDQLEKIYKQQITEPRQESLLIQEITKLSRINDSVSLSVREQYENNPYPRWITTSVPTESITVRELIKRQNLQIFIENYVNIRNPEILIAGCGTGQHSIGTAKRFKNASVLAVDLSLSSLAYAKRKSDELRVTNLSYAQCDILEIKNIGRKFDIIESVGVLHHMNDPIAGWESLLQLLNYGGIMKIGLYSSYARSYIRELRKLTMSNPGEEQDIRSLRNAIMNSSDAASKRVISSTDFYTLSTVKDLLFHVKEHQFTLMEIKEVLSELGLMFMGFDNHVMNETVPVEIDTPEQKLTYWNEKEISNPDLFAGMYQFWCQKV